MIPSPTKPTRSPPESSCIRGRMSGGAAGAVAAALASAVVGGGGGAGAAVTAAPGRLERQPVAYGQRARRLRLQLLAVEQVAPPRARLAARRPGRGVTAALGDERVGHRRQRLELADDPVAAAPGAVAAGAAPDRVAGDAQRELELERLDRRVERVRH